LLWELLTVEPCRSVICNAVFSVVVHITLSLSGYLLMLMHIFSALCYLYSLLHKNNCVGFKETIGGNQCSLFSCWYWILFYDCIAAVIAWVNEWMNEWMNEWIVFTEQQNVHMLIMCRHQAQPVGFIFALHHLRNMLRLSSKVSSSLDCENIWPSCFNVHSM